MGRPDSVDLRNQWVHFRIRDVYIPDPQALLLNLYGSDLLQGQVIDLSDSGTPQGTFAVVKVNGLDQPVIVPIDRVLGVL